MENKKMKISSPWNLYIAKLHAMFDQDHDIRIEFDEEKLAVSLYVSNQSKAKALQELMPCEKEFGNVTLSIKVIPANTEMSVAELYQLAFMNNPVLHGIVPVSEISFEGTYVVFKNEVVQYFADNVGDLHGLNSTLYQEIAKDLFNEVNGAFYCTDIERESY